MLKIRSIGLDEPVETDLLLGIPNVPDCSELPAPVTQSGHTKPPLAFSMSETFMHMLGISITLGLIAFSVYLTLANVMM